MRNSVLRKISLLLCVMLILSVAGCSSNAPASASKSLYQAGTYTAIGNGRNGPIVVQVKFSNDAITDVRVVSHNETYHVGDIPIKTYPDLIVKNQSLAVDVVSGATISSTALLSAIRQCVKDAGGDPSKLNAPIPADVKAATDTTADVVVVGGGAAGMTAASTAASAGKKVILVEKLAFLGGTSAYSIESFGASETKVHKTLGVTATADDMYANYIKSYPKGIPQAFNVLAHKSGEAANWLWSIGAPLTVTNSTFSVTASREAGKMGQIITSALMDEVKKRGVDCRVNTRATELVMEGGAVAGVKVKGPAGEYTIRAKSVILATGGFAANNEMVAKYKPELKGYKNSCSVGATGDGQLMAEAVGAQLRDMDNIRVNFTYYTDGLRVYYMGSLPNTGAIFVNKDGKRFINDQAGYGAGMAVVAQGGTGWMIFDQSLIDSIQDVREYYNLGIFVSAPTIEELADKIGVDKKNLAATVERYVGFVKKGVDEDFKRTMLNMTFDEPPYYACKMTCHVQGTFGGIATDTNAQVLKKDGTVISGLYAAGECASVGTYGANPMLTNVVFGRIAGQNAAAYVK
ncbi:MAG: flavocytochrome c [Clostridiales bacterium]|jgi:fumarate reductase flavoprotein subunit|nr:flavocytochrome c [Eubacteriales bacterium]MDH7565999.1 flavocytochrome c [Clostridiales bacterium]